MSYLLQEASLCLIIWWQQQWLQDQQEEQPQYTGTFQAAPLAKSRHMTVPKVSAGGHYQRPGYRWWEKIQKLLQSINPSIQGSLGGDQSTEQVCPRCSVQFSSVTQLCLTLCNSMNRSTLGLPVHHQLLEFTQTHVHQVGDAIQPSHPLSSPSPPAPSSSSLPAMSQLFA